MLICNLILTLLATTPFAQETAGICVKISLFEVPSMIVSYTVAGWSTPDGGVAGTTVGGNTTWSFPSRPVVLQNRLPAGSGSVDIKTAIREFMAYGCIRPQHIAVHELAEHELVVDRQGEPGQEVIKEIHQGRPSPLSFRLEIGGAWQNEDETGLALQIRLSSQDPSAVQDISGDIPERLVFDQTVSVTLGQTTLLGFPSSDSRARRSIFWLALSAEGT